MVVSYADAKIEVQGLGEDWSGGRGESLGTLITPRGFRWGQWFRGRAGIDALVYELYGLTEEEIGVVERQGGNEPV
jgi:hypothetical protein